MNPRIWPSTTWRLNAINLQQSQLGVKNSIYKMCSILAIGTVHRPAHVPYTCTRKVLRWALRITEFYYALPSVRTNLNQVLLKVPTGIKVLKCYFLPLWNTKKETNVKNNLKMPKYLTFWSFGTKIWRIWIYFYPCWKGEKHCPGDRGRLES